MTATASSSNACELVQMHVGAYVDGELEPSSSLDFDRHLGVCEECHERLAFELATREHLRDALLAPRSPYGDVAAPAGLADRVRSALREEDRAEAPDPSSVVPEGDYWRPGWRVMPAAAAAAAVIFAGAAYSAQSGRVRGAEALADVVRVHSAALPADVTVSDRAPASPNVVPVQNGFVRASNGRASEASSSDRVANWFRGKVGFPVRPAEFASRDVRLVGARVSNVRERQAAALYYEVGGHRMTVVVTDLPLGDSADEVHVEGRRLRYQELHGHRVPVREESGLSYAFTGDVDRETLLHLAASARVP